jgi:hypothetical protein
MSAELPSPSFEEQPRKDSQRHEKVPLQHQKAGESRSGVDDRVETDGGGAY